MEQGRVAVWPRLRFQYKQRVASMLPMGIYTIPEISAAGETEDSCKEKKIDHCVGRAHYDNNARGHICGDTSGLLKIIFSPTDKKTARPQYYRRIRNRTRPHRDDGARQTASPSTNSSIRFLITRRSAKCIHTPLTTDLAIFPVTNLREG